MSKQGYNGSYRERYKTEVEASIKKDQTIKATKQGKIKMNELAKYYRERYKTEVEASIKKDQTIKMQKEAIQEQAELINDLSKRNLNLAYDNSDLREQIEREGSFKAAALCGWIIVSLLIFKEMIG